MLNVPTFKRSNVPTFITQGLPLQRIFQFRNPNSELRIPDRWLPNNSSDLRLKVGEEALDTILQTCYYLEGRFLSMEKAENDT
jgi:hypothetical protein